MKRELIINKSEQLDMQSKEEPIEAIPFIQLLPKKGFQVTSHAELFLASLD